MKELNNPFVVYHGSYIVYDRFFGMWLKSH